MVERDRHAIDVQRHEALDDAGNESDRRQHDEHARRPPPRHASDEDEQQKPAIQEREALPREPGRPKRRANEARNVRARVEHRKEQPHRVAEDGEGDGEGTAGRVERDERAVSDDVERNEDRDDSGEETHARIMEGRVDYAAWRTSKSRSICRMPAVSPIASSTSSSATAK